MSIGIMPVAEAPGGVELHLVTLLPKLKNHPSLEYVLMCSSAYDLGKSQSPVPEVSVVNAMRNAISPAHDLRAIVAVRRTIRR